MFREDAEQTSRGREFKRASASLKLVTDSCLGDNLLTVEVWLFFGILLAMDPADYHKVDRILELVEENNQKIKKLYRAARWSRVLRIIYLIIIIGASLGIYYYVQPYFDSLLNTYSGLKESIQNLPIL